MEIAILGDLHGKIYEALKRCREWEKQNKKLDLILQLGDFGVWPGEADKQTQIRAAKDPRELGFKEFITLTPRARELLNELEAQILFVTGNHEDFEYLKKFQATGPIFPVDTLKRLWCLKSGHVFEYEKDEEKIRIAGIGGIDKSTRAKKYPEEAYIKDADKLMHSEFDILISHDGPKDICEKGKGSQEITNILKSRKPAFAFFAHYKTDAKNSFLPTKIYHLNKLYSFDQRIHSSMGILTWNGKKEFKYA